jgi:Phosphomannomutase
VPAPLSRSEHGAITEVDLFEPYANNALGVVGADLSGLTVVYDAMHGSGRDTTDALLERADAEVRRLRCDRDPEFGGTEPEPGRDTLGDLVEQVRMTDADLGVANDGDADRVAVVTPERGVLDENLLFATVYDDLLADDRLDAGPGPAVRTVSTTFMIDRVAEAHGQSVVEMPVGFKWVAEAMADHDALMGGEESGGFSVRGHVREKDGVLMALLAAAVEADRPIDRRVETLLTEYGDIHQDKTSVDCPDDRKAAAIDALGERIPDSVAGESVDNVVTADGFKLLLADGSWVLVRPSGTEPVLRVYAEADSRERVTDLLDAGRDLVSAVV